MFLSKTKKHKVIKEVYRIPYAHRHRGANDKPTRRKSEPVLLADILPDVMTDIKKRMNSWTKENRYC